MSVKIGDVFKGAHGETKVGEVWASIGGTEVHWTQSTAPTNLDPIAARNYAALLVRASDEVERMRCRHNWDELIAARPSREPFPL